MVKFELLILKSEIQIFFNKNQILIEINIFNKH